MNDRSGVALRRFGEAWTCGRWRHAAWLPVRDSSSRTAGRHALPAGRKTYAADPFLKYGWIRTSAEMPSRLWSFRIMSIVRARRRLSSSATLAQLPKNGSRSCRVRPRLSM